jgi:nitrite reductase/ring-hydroxylating ferredoxin subunit
VPRGAGWPDTLPTGRGSGNTRLAAASLKWHRLDIDPDAEDGSLLGVRCDGRALVAGRVGGTWHAAEDACPHAGCAFSEDGALEGATLICECHGSEFELQSGAVTAGPATEPLIMVAVRRAGAGLEAGW